MYETKNKRSIIDIQSYTYGYNEIKHTEDYPCVCEFVCAYVYAFIIKAKKTRTQLTNKIEKKNI